MSQEPNLSNSALSEPSTAAASVTAALPPTSAINTLPYSITQPQFSFGTSVGIAANLNAAFQLWKSFNYSDAQVCMSQTFSKIYAYIYLSMHLEIYGQYCCRNGCKTRRKRIFSSPPC